MRAHILAAFVAGASCACNHTPISGLEESFSIRVDVSNRDVGATKIDFLWVVDNSTSMCQEQAALTRSFDTFVAALETSFAVDARIAVTSVASRCPGTLVPGGAGTFNRKPSGVATEGCGESVRRRCDVTSLDRCGGNLDCEVLGLCDSTTPWLCNGTDLPGCAENPNGTFNQWCTRTCASDAECQEVFGDVNLRCVARDAVTACAYQPPIADCPDDLPLFLEKNGAVDNTRYFHCIASVGFATSSCFDFEEPLRSAQMALGLDPDVDESGQRANLEQAAAFVRDDAYLVIIIVTDEEDCSIDAAHRDALDESTYGAKVYSNCGVFGDFDSGGPLTPVNHFVNRFKALKEDPSKVIVAAVAGDALGTEAEQSAARELYLELKLDPEKECHGDAYICESANGIADHAARLRLFTDAFGPNGTFENICGDEGIGPALERVADRIVAIANRMCLPKPILGQMSVTRTRGGVVTELEEGQGPGRYTITHVAEECAVDGQPLPAISLWDRPEPDDVIDVRYEGDPLLP